MMEIVIDKTLDDWPVAERDWENHYFYGIWKGKRYARLHLQFTAGVCYIHLYIERWNSGVLRVMREDFKSLRELAKGKGATRLVGAVGCKDAALDKWEKMLRLVGFPEPSPVRISGEACMMTVMEI